MPLTILLALALLWTPQSPAPPQADPLAALIARIEKAASAGDREAIRGLGVDPASALELAAALTTPVPSRILIKERDRTKVAENRQRLLLEVFWERALEGRLGTWNVDVEQDADGWRIASATRLAHVTGLYRLALDRAKQFDIRNLTVKAPDLTLQISSGAAFVAETPEGVTAVVLLGRGQMRFTPPDAAERTQVRIFGGEDLLESRFDRAFIRVKPEDFAARFPAGTLVERAVSHEDLRRAEDVFDEYIGRTLQINLSDLSPDRWSITPQGGDIIAEVDTNRWGTLTYTRSRNDAEDVTVFDRRRRRNISVYASAEKLATRGRFYSEDDLVDYDVLAYDVEATILPDRERIEGNARLKIKVRAAAATTLNLRLAEDLAVHGVYSPDYGRLLHLRVVNQNALIVSLPGAIIHGTEIWLNVIYSGRMPPQELDREAISVQQDQQEITIPAEPRFLYSNRTHWYPQSSVSDYATTRLSVSVPSEYEVIATGTPVGPPAPAPGVVTEDRDRRRFIFESQRPVRYIACVVSRLRQVETRHVELEAPAGGAVLHVRANPRQVGRARDNVARAAEIFQYYARLVGDAPYPSFTLAFTERDAPGGHSPAYFAVVDQPLQQGLSWRGDPVNFDHYPAFFMAHEIAHQWWGQGVGWKNYHEQWLSEGFAQYFAALYAEEKLSSGVMPNLLRQMRQTAMRQSSQGPIYLGYRLGHIKADQRVFRSIIYNKSAMVLHMLRRVIGDDAFFRGVRDFYTAWKYRKAGTDDLMATMEKAAGRDLSKFFDAWVFGVVIPQVKFTHKVDGSRLTLRFEQPGIPVEVPIGVRLQYASGRVEHLVVVAAESVTEKAVELKERLRSVSANADHGALADIR